MITIVLTYKLDFKQEAKVALDNISTLLTSQYLIHVYQVFIIIKTPSNHFKGKKALLFLKKTLFNMYVSI